MNSSSSGKIESISMENKLAPARWAPTIVGRCCKLGFNSISGGYNKPPSYPNDFRPYYRGRPHNPMPITGSGGPAHRSWDWLP